MVPGSVLALVTTAALTAVTLTAMTLTAVTMMAESVVTRVAGTVRPVSVCRSVGAVPPASLLGSLPVIGHFSTPSIQ